jgi:hypothetical protein
MTKGCAILPVKPTTISPPQHAMMVKSVALCNAHLQLRQCRSALFRGSFWNGFNLATNKHKGSGSKKSSAQIVKSELLAMMESALEINGVTMLSAGSMMIKLRGSAAIAAVSTNKPSTFGQGMREGFCLMTARETGS